LYYRLVIAYCWKLVQNTGKVIEHAFPLWWKKNNSENDKLEIQMEMPEQAILINNEKKPYEIITSNSLFVKM